ncbi:Hypothetical Protein FCC1311_012172 [Hondaea fermentalgiana]|uniref:Uncharacterized protein n=1 Tax=Hondaea fermentalgiana TaxID=2315210 RepID=A0A2R5G1W0_9STRA|nr:Hypothetical Protein FCC1311_012172 [Hondaea fermentalgiana]|eukprot:GBG25000.1 Hypothetical Protein FCC1311_012172 [Hondaea fermentalgiana]
MATARKQQGAIALEAWRGLCVPTATSEPTLDNLREHAKAAGPSSIFDICAHEYKCKYKRKRKCFKARRGPNKTSFNTAVFFRCTQSRQVTPEQLDTVERVAQFLETARVAWASLVAASIFGAGAIGFYSCMAVYPNTTLFEALGNISLTVLLLFTTIFSYRQERAQLRMALLVAGQRHSVSRSFVLETVLKWRQNAKRFPIAANPSSFRHLLTNHSEPDDGDAAGEEIDGDDNNDSQENGYSWESVYNKIMALLGFAEGANDGKTFAGREIHPSARSAPHIPEDAMFDLEAQLETQRRPSSSRGP